MVDRTNEPGRMLPVQSRTVANPAGPGLKSPGYLGQWPLIGLVMVILGLAAFGVFAFNVQTNGPLIQGDVAATNNVHQFALSTPQWFRDLMIAGYYIGQHVIVAIGALLALYFIFRKYWMELAMVVVAWAGEGSLWLILAPYFGRTRPVFDTPVWHVMDAPSFPSGHTIAAVMCYGLLAYLSVPWMRSRLARALMIAFAVVMIAWVAFSRFFIGDHYLIDVLAGLAMGVAWSGLVYTLVELLARKRREAKAKRA